MKKIIRIILIVLMIALIVMQFFRPEKNNGGYDTVTAFETETKVSPEVASILRANCYDCHSNQTEYPWYGEVAPFSFWMQDHIKHAKGHFNVSEWDTYSTKKKDHKLEEVLEMLEKGEMPLDSYTWIHGNLKKDDQKLLLQWATLARLQYKTQLEYSFK